MAKKVLIAFLFLPLLVLGCKKKDRLSSNTYSLSVVPPATTAVINVPKTFTVEGRAPGGNVVTDPEWTIFPSSGATVITPTLPLFGPSITLNFSAVGFYVLTATFEDKTASTQVRILASTPSTISNSGNIFNDQGIPTGAQVFAGGLSLSEPTGGAAEGNKFMRASGVTSSFWMVDLQTGLADLDSFPGGTIKFFIRLDRPLALGETLRLEMQRPNNGPKQGVVSGILWNGFSGSNTGWQEVSIDLSNFFLGQGTIQAPFIFVTSVGAPVMTIDIDFVRWEK